MAQVSRESFTGTLKLWDVDCTFSFFNEVYLEIKPIPSSIETSLDKGTQRKTTENELPSLTQCTA